MFVSPMLLQKSDHPFEDDQSYITELKIDGIRLILSKFNGKIRLYTRHRNEVTSKFPELTSIDIPDGTVLDGELVVPGEDGKPDFEATMERFMSSKSDHVINYCVFDIIYLNNEKVTYSPLLERKKLLEETLPPNHPHVVPVQWTYGNQSTYFELVKEHGLEGIVMKKVDHSPYEIGKRSHSWLKVINYQYEEVWITGLRKEKFGLLLSFLNGEPAGVMEFVPSNERKQLYSMMKVNKETDQYKYIEPIMCKVKYRNLTKQGKLRIPSFHNWNKTTIPS